MAYEDYTVRQFMNALFKNDRTVMNDEEFKLVHDEYVDTAGLFESEEFDKVCYIHYLNGRINSIKLSIKLQKQFIDLFDIPFIPELKFFKKYGHTVRWNNNIERFKSDLDRVETKERKYVSMLEKNMKELIDMRAKKNENAGDQPKTKQSRGGFIKTVNSLGKVGYKIDMDKTTVEEMAYMIKQQTEELADLKNKS